MQRRPMDVVFLMISSILVELGAFLFTESDKKCLGVGTFTSYCQNPNLATPTNSGMRYAIFSSLTKITEYTRD